MKLSALETFQEEKLDVLMPRLTSRHEKKTTNIFTFSTSSMFWDKSSKMRIRLMSKWKVLLVICRLSGHLKWCRKNSVMHFRSFHYVCLICQTDYSRTSPVDPTGCSFSVNEGQTGTCICCSFFSSNQNILKKGFFQHEKRQAGTIAMIPHTSLQMFMFAINVNNLICIQTARLMSWLPQKSLLSAGSICRLILSGLTALKPSRTCWGPPFQPPIMVSRCLSMSHLMSPLVCDRRSRASPSFYLFFSSGWNFPISLSACVHSLITSAAPLLDSTEQISLGLIASVIETIKTTK